MDNPPNSDRSYIPYQQWPEYHVENDVPDYFKAEPINYNGILGARWHIGPFHLEECVSDTEPKPSITNQSRVHYWQRVYRNDVPKGWHTGFFAKSTHRIGYAVIKENEYWKAWPETTRYYRRKWYKEQLGINYRIERVPFSEYKDAYLKSSVVKVVGLRQIEKLERKLAVASEHLDLWGVRKINTGEIVAGLGVLNSPTYHSSNHFSAFMHEGAKKDRVSLGLVDHWFKESLAHGIKLLDFGIFWQKGDPDSFKGFSEFKGQFDVQFISLPPRLFKLIWKK